MYKGEIEDISKADCKLISQKILDDIYKPAYNFKTTVFLCGADINDKDKIRYKTSLLLKNEYLFDIVYPEDIFDELLFSSKTSDLLSLEGLLAESVDAIVVIPESPGSFAELGAFANDKKLVKKLICVVDKSYKKHKSFINQGPLKLIRNENKFAVLYIDTNKIKSEYTKLISALKKMKKLSLKATDKLSLLQLENFLIPAIYLLEPVTKKTLIFIVSGATEDDKNSFQITTIGLTILIKKKIIKLTSEGYKLTELGLESVFEFRRKKSRIKNQWMKNDFDNIKLEILNLVNRKKKLRV